MHSNTPGLSRTRWPARSAKRSFGGGIRSPTDGSRQQADTIHPPGVLESVPSSIRISRAIPPAAIRRWLGGGWADFLGAPLPSLAVGLVCTLISWVLVAALAATDSAVLILPLTAGFVFIAPLLAVGLYESSRRQAHGERVTFGCTMAALERNPVQITIMSALLTLLIVGWLGVVILLLASFTLIAWLVGFDIPPLQHVATVASLARENWDLVLAVIAIGAVLAVLGFGLTAVSLPMLVDRPIGAIKAGATSMRVCCANPVTMALWAATILGLTLIAAAPAFLGFIVALPVLGHASWRAYRDLVGPCRWRSESA